MIVVRDRISATELTAMAEGMFGNLVKAVVDVERRIMAVDGELHSDEEALLIEDNSNQRDLWGINIYPEIKDEHWIEFDSLINIRPSQDNRSRGVNDPAIRKTIVDIVGELVER